MPDLLKLLHDRSKVVRNKALLQQFGTKLSYFVFYLLDNLTVLTRLGFIRFANFKYATLREYAYTVLMLGQFSALGYYLLKLRQSFKKENDLKQIMVSNLTPQEFIAHILNYNEERRIYI